MPTSPEQVLVIAALDLAILDRDWDWLTSGARPWVEGLDLDWDAWCEGIARRRAAKPKSSPRWTGTHQPGPPKPMTTKVTRAQAAKAIRQAALDLKAAQPELTVRAIAEAVGRSPGWVSLVLRGIDP